MPWCNGAMYRVHDEQTVRRVVACRGVMAQCTGYTMNKQSGGW